NEPSYTVAMLERIDRQFFGAELFFIIGEDSLRDFGTWHHPELILRLTKLAVAARPGVVVGDELYRQVAGLREQVIKFSAPLLEVSSTALRNRVHEGKSIRYLVPATVCEYIQTHRLYQESDAPSDHSIENDMPV
ncbi:MAG: nicotinate-nicotinamide nucleotide adenylyltransferase, partial [Thermomicrobiales bacterium]